MFFVIEMKQKLAIRQIFSDTNCHNIYKLLFIKKLHSQLVSAT